MPTPYIGVTGFTKRFDVDLCLGLIPPKFGRLLMVGVLVSSKTLAGKKNKWPNRYPPVEKVKDILPLQPALSLIHYNTDEPETLLDQLALLYEMTVPNLSGFQLNMAWPPKKTLETFKRYRFLTKFVLQVGHTALEQVSHSPKQLVDKVSDYGRTIDYVLLDPSGGLGIPMDTNKMLEYLQALDEAKLGIGLGVAGGLSPTTMALVTPLIDQYPNLSIDAEGKLRNAEDQLDLELATSYLRQAVALFAESRRKAYG